MREKEQINAYRRYDNLDTALSELRRYDNLDTALSELKNANYTIREYVEDEDTKEDYFSSISRTQLLLEEITWIAFIDLLISSIKLNGKEEYNILTNNMDTDINKLEELKVFLEDTSDLLKELI